jgi:hypothetical protein
MNCLKSFNIKLEPTLSYLVCNCIIARHRAQLLVGASKFRCVFLLILSLDQSVFEHH